jgi:hypothetical protein
VKTSFAFLALIELELDFSQEDVEFCRPQTQLHHLIEEVDKVTVFIDQFFSIGEM